MTRSLSAAITALQILAYSCLAGCQDDCWVKLKTFEHRDMLTSIWASSADDIFVGGYTEKIAHFDGESWSDDLIPDGMSQVGHLWGRGPDDVYATSTGLLHYDGSGWSEVEGAPGGLGDIWGDPDGNLFYAGNSGVFRYDGQTWTDMGAPVPEDPHHFVEGLWGTSGQDLFVVGWEDGSGCSDCPAGWIMHYDGQEWTEPVRKRSRRFLDVWGSSGTDVFVVGDRDEIQHWDGSTWEDWGQGEFRQLTGVWGSSGSNVFATGRGILHYDGETWSEWSSKKYSLHTVWGCSDTDVFAAGCRLHRDSNDVFCMDGAVLKYTCGR